MLLQSCSFECWLGAVVVGMIFGSAVTIFVMLVLRWKKKRENGFMMSDRYPQ